MNIQLSNSVGPFPGDSEASVCLLSKAGGRSEIEKLKLRDQNQKIIITAVVLFFLILTIFAFIIYST